MARVPHIRATWWVLVAALVVGSSVPGIVLATAAPSSSGPAGAASAAARTATASAPQQHTLRPSARPFAASKSQLAARARAMAGLARHLAPTPRTRTTSAQAGMNGGPQTAMARQAPGDFKVLKSSLINSTCSGCAQSAINEPSVANNGKVVVETSNWNIAYSTNAGAATPTWLNLSPYSFSSGFCCDQEVTYDPERNIFVLLQLDYAGEGSASNGLAISVAKGKTPTSWCTYKFAGALGGGATDTPDFPKIGLANGNAYITWNDYPANAGFARSGLARMPLDSLAGCAAFSFNFLTRSTEFTFALSKAGSSLDTFYWVSNWFLDGTTSGSNLRIFYWPENSGTYFFVTRAINAFNFGVASCGTPNWCSRLDPRYESVVITRAEYRAQANAAFAGDSILEVAGTAGPSGFSNGQNYVVYNYFKLNSLSYIGNDQTYNTTFSFAYPGCAVNNHGYVGCAMSEGSNAPGGLLVLQDVTNPTQPWGFNFAVGGVNGASGWGDYVVTSPWNPAVGPFQTVLWRVNSSNVVQPYYLVFGRARDAAGYNRWKTS